jgi:hypothetical protein
MGPLLSIIIPTVKIREKHLNRLLSLLESQINEHNLQDKIEILVHQDSMQTSLGDKANVMIQRASGLFVVGMGDDDTISDNYCKILCDTIESNPDVDQITYGVKQINKFLKSIICRYSLKNKNFRINFGFFQLIFKTFGDLKNKTNEDFDFAIFNKKIISCKRNSISHILVSLLSILFIWNVRNTQGYAWTILPMKKEIAEQVKFTNATRCQDKEWVMEIRDRNLLKSEVVLSDVLYFYNYTPKNSLSRDRDRFKKNLKAHDITHEKKEINIKNLIWV